MFFVIELAVITDCNASLKIFEKLSKYKDVEVENVSHEDINNYRCNWNNRAYFKWLP